MIKLRGDDDYVRKGGEEPILITARGLRGDFL